MRMGSGGGGGGSGGGRVRGGRLKKGKLERKTETRPGRFHKSTSSRAVGWEAHANRCGTVCGSTPHDGQRELSDLPTRSR